MKLLYFTATGNSLYVAKRLGGELISIPRAIKAGNYKFSEDKIGLIFPIFWIDVPTYVEAFLRKVELDSDYVFALMTYGTLEGFTASRLARIGKKAGIDFAYVNSLRTVDNYLPSFDMEEQIAAEPAKRIEEQLEAVIADIAASRKRVPKPSLLGDLATGAAHALVKPKEALASSFRVEEDCGGCGICASVCPVGNVALSGGRPEFGPGCVNCLACAQSCPRASIRVRNEKSRARYRNPHVSLKEIAEANGQGRAAP